MQRHRQSRWTPGETRQLRERAAAGEDAVDIALAMDKPLDEVKDRLFRLRRAGVLKDRSREAREADEVERLSGRMETYRLMEVMTDEEAYAYGLCSEAMREAAKAWNVEDALAAAMDKIDRAIGTR